MKKLLVFLLCMSMVLSFAACGDDSGKCTDCGKETTNYLKTPESMRGRYSEDTYICDDCLAIIGLTYEQAKKLMDNYDKDMADLNRKTQELRKNK